MGNKSELIQRGFYPDPSICRVDDLYYMVHSTFSYAPGIPVYISENLHSWRQLGHVLTRENQLKLKGGKMSGGIFAPTIRYDNGLFYVIVTNVTYGGNFYVTASAPEGPWSDPVYLPDADGIDPSLYFEHGRCYYIGQRNKKDAAYFGDCEIWMRELDVDKKQLAGPEYILWDGAMKNAVWPEGPHLYKKDGYYYLLIAEGGTEYSHSINVARSCDISGPYESCRNNPVFTHRHLGKDYPIQNAGHADLVDAPDGKWYAVMLATRPYQNKTELGRETYLTEVLWEDDWPVFCPGEGRIDRACAEVITRENSICWNQELDMQCLMLRGILDESAYELMDEKVVMHCKKETLSDLLTPCYIGVRLQERCFSCKTTVSIIPMEKEEAGLAYYYDENNYAVFVLRRELDKMVTEVRLIQNGKEQVIGRKWIEENTAELNIKSKERKAQFLANRECVATASLDELTTEIAGGFVGCTIGIYATAKGESSSVKAAFERLQISYGDIRD